MNAPLPPQRRLAVGVFDSGVGGLSVLPALHRALPQAHLTVVADSGHAPYGERDESWIRARCLQMAAFLREQGADLMVLACNSATAAAAPALRALHPGWPIVGIEPGIKPAVQQSRSGRVGVMATAATLRSERFARLLADHGQDAEVVTQACTGLAMAIEQGHEARIRDLVEIHTEGFRRAKVDTLVLGCTHYPFARQWIETVVGPDVRIIDTAEAVARQAASLVQHLVPACEGMAAPWDDVPSMEFWTSGDPAALQAFAKRWLGWSIRPRALPAPAAEPDAAATGR